MTGPFWRSTLTDEFIHRANEAGCHDEICQVMGRMKRACEKAAGPVQYFYMVNPITGDFEFHAYPIGAKP